jgi:hypothetical protein
MFERIRGDYSRHSARLILAEVAREHGDEAADRLIHELLLDELYGLAPGTTLDPKRG